MAFTFATEHLTLILVLLIIIVGPTYWVWKVRQVRSQADAHAYANVFDLIPHWPAEGKKGDDPVGDGLLRLFVQCTGCRFTLRVLMSCESQLSKGELVEAVNKLRIGSGRNPLPANALEAVADILVSSGFAGKFEGQYYCITEDGKKLFAKTQTLGQ